MPAGGPDADRRLHRHRIDQAHLRDAGAESCEYSKGTSRIDNCGPPGDDAARFRPASGLIREVHGANLRQTLASHGCCSCGAPSGR
jgi:hypothetical protein